ncbi:ATP synthase subunit e, mitochondrial-like [Lucilia cuprina]|uniref:ATP synthase subunit e, mitochondrial-like n=1 Tax=Lucilia cuprina TaxID=7375 RepID=UPI001F05F671|nr:ATP synthase subunit e, mitochondrial-like [Lucilia cuprina]
MSQPPIAVSPLIKFGRWSMLSLGIIYGVYNQKRLSQKEAKFREAEAKQNAIRDAKLAEERKRLAEAEMHAIDILSGKIL